MDDPRWERALQLIARLRALAAALPQPVRDRSELAARIRPELRRYDEHRDRLSPPDRERLLEFVVEDLVGLVEMYAPARGASPGPDSPAPDAAGPLPATPAFRLLVDAGRVLAGSLEYEAALDRLARLCTAWLADACLVHLADGGGRMRCVAAVHRDPAGRGHALGADAGALEPDDPSHPVAVALRSGRTVRIPGAVADRPGGAPPGGGERPAGEMPDAGAALIVPLTARGRVLGTLTLARTAGRFTDDEAALAEELARRAALAVEDARLRDEVERAGRAKAEFVAAISHEFRTPLTTVAAFAHLLREGIPVPVPGEAREHAGRILGAVAHLERLVEESLGFRRVEAGWQTVRSERVDLGALARETAAMVEPLARQKGLDFVVDAELADPAAETDADKVRQILFSLLDNAVRFTDSGGVRLVVGARAGRAVLEVSDTGIGIAPEHLERIFEPFWQAEPGSARRGPGIGLGLALARRLAWLLGGDVRVESEPGRGSVFRAEIPPG